MAELVSELKAFLDLPSELRLRIYDFLLAPLNIASPQGSRSPFMPPWGSHRTSYPSTVPQRFTMQRFEVAKPNRTIPRTIALPNAHSLQSSQGILLSCHQVYREIENELLQRHVRYFLSLDKQWPHLLRLPKPALLRHTNDVTIGVLWSCIEQPGMDRPSRETRRSDSMDPVFQDLVSSLVDNVPSFTLYMTGLTRASDIDYVSPVSVIDYSTEWRLADLMNYALEAQLLARGTDLTFRNAPHNFRMHPKHHGWDTHIVDRTESRQYRPTSISYNVRFG